MKEKTESHVKEYTSYALGAFGHDAFYATLSTYLMLFITSELFNGAAKGVKSHMILIITTMMMIIRLVEIVFDPIIGGIIDNTQTKYGKFKPWLLVGAGVSAIFLVLIFTDFGGLTNSNPMLYVVLFGICYVIMDVFYSFKDIALWSMLPALSVDEKVRNNFGTTGRLGSTIGAQAVPIMIFPLIVFFSHMFSGTSGQTKTQAGWIGFAVVIAIFSFGGALCTALGTHENTSLIRQNTERTGVIGIFKALGKNDQLMWLAASYFLFALGYVVTNSLLAYYFTYVLGQSNKFTFAGWIMAALGVISVSLFPVIVEKVHRKAIYVGGICMMLIGYVLFLFAGHSLTAVLVSVAIFFFPYPMIFLAALMTITDCVEYGQWKNGTRNESVTLSIRPLIDKLAGAVANGVVGIAAVHSGMTGNASPSSISHAQLMGFKSYMFFGPMALIAVAALVYYVKVKLTEDKHKEIVDELETKLEKEQDEKVKQGTADEQ